MHGEIRYQAPRWAESENAWLNNGFLVILKRSQEDLLFPTCNDESNQLHLDLLACWLQKSRGY